MREEGDCTIQEEQNEFKTNNFSHPLLTHQKAPAQLEQKI
jgi:hypothetical protein